MLCCIQQFPLPGFDRDSAEEGFIGELEDSREVMDSLREEYEACEKDNYIDRLTGNGLGHAPPTSAQADGRMADTRIAAN